jgi:hypothetical protein
MTYRLCTLKNASDLIGLICKPYQGNVSEIITEELRANLILTLKITVEKVKINFEMHKSLVSLVHIFEKAQE